jgi:hypothetical protein
MYENELIVNDDDVLNTENTQGATRHLLLPTDEAKISNLEVNTANVIPKPVFMRLLILFGVSIGCLFVGIIVSLVTADWVLLVMSAILGTAFAIKGFLLKRKITVGQLYNVSGVCISIIPKLLGRYRRIELVNTDTGDDVSFILPKKVIFKIGHVYTCYFDDQINDRAVSINRQKGGYIGKNLDLPTNGFLGFEDFGVYQEKPVIEIIAVNDKIKNCKEEENHESITHQ